MAFDTMTKEIKDKTASKPGGGGGRQGGNAPAFGQGKQLKNETPGGEPSAQQLNSVNLKKKRNESGKGGCC